jgi:hypothetical protein
VDPGSLRYKVVILKPSNTQGSDFGNGEENSVEQFQKQLKFIFRYEAFWKQIKENGTITYDNEIFRINSVRFRGSGNRCYVEVVGKSFE